jgi:hypothetical protein
MVSQAGPRALVAGVEGTESYGGAHDIVRARQLEKHRSSPKAQYHGPEPHRSAFTLRADARAQASERAGARDVTRDGPLIANVQLPGGST